MNSLKIAKTDIPIFDLFKERWSPRSFRNQPLEHDKLIRIFEAARWSASSFNEQPWRFVIGEQGKGESYNKIFSTLAEGNKVWCKHAPFLMLIIAKQTFSHNGKPNHHAIYDCGQAAAYISMQALKEGIYVHQMAGFSVAKARKLFEIPEDFLPVTAMAAGYPGEPEILPENLQKSETAPRNRRDLATLVFGNIWSRPADIF